MLTDLVVEDFQSIKHAHFRLGKLTVITGPTGSGKSGSLRAFHLAAFNRRGAIFIRHGAKSCTVGFGSQDEGWFIAIERGGRGKDAYRVAWAEPNQNVGVQVFTKLEGKAPPEILDVHRLTPLNFVSQLDMPFLLDASGAEVARILGDLTNVSLVYEAAREGARRRQRISGELKRAESEVTSLTEQVQQYSALPVQLAAQQRAEQALARAQEAELDIHQLRQFIEMAMEAAANVGWAQQKAAAAEPPSLDRAEIAFRDCQRLSALIGEAEDAAAEALAWEQKIPSLELAIDRAHEAFHATLQEMGTCPTCGQSTGK